MWYPPQVAFHFAKIAPKNQNWRRWTPYRNLAQSSEDRRLAHHKSQCGALVQAGRRGSEGRECRRGAGDGEGEQRIGISIISSSGRLSPYPGAIPFFHAIASFSMCSNPRPEFPEAMLSQPGIPRMASRSGGMGENQNVGKQTCCRLWGERLFG